MFDVDIEESRRNNSVHVYTLCQKCGERIHSENFCTNCGTKTIELYSRVFLSLEDAENKLVTRKLNQAGFVKKHTTSTGVCIKGGRRFETFLYCSTCDGALDADYLCGKTMYCCPHCGKRFGLPCHDGKVDVFFTDAELKDYILEVFYKKYPEFKQS